MAIEMRMMMKEELRLTPEKLIEMIQYLFHGQGMSFTNLTRARVRVRAASS
jgi:hypothetical protein